jgi:hypothetical protein
MNKFTDRHRPLAASSSEVSDVKGWHAALKKHGYTSYGNLRGCHATAFALDKNGKKVGFFSGDAGYVSESPEKFAIDYLDDIVRLQEGIRNFKGSTADVAALEETLRARRVQLKG